MLYPNRRARSRHETCRGSRRPIIGSPMSSGNGGCRAWSRNETCRNGRYLIIGSPTSSGNSGCRAWSRNETCRNGRYLIIGSPTSSGNSGCRAWSRNETCRWPSCNVQLLWQFSYLNRAPQGCHQGVLGQLVDPWSLTRCMTPRASWNGPCPEREIFVQCAASMAGLVPRPCPTRDDNHVATPVLHCSRAGDPAADAAG